MPTNQTKQTVALRQLTVLFMKDISMFYRCPVQRWANFGLKQLDLETNTWKTMIQFKANIFTHFHRAIPVLFLLTHHYFSTSTSYATVLLKLNPLFCVKQYGSKHCLSVAMQWTAMYKLLESCCWILWKKALSFCSSAVDSHVFTAGIFLLDCWPLWK